MLLHSLQNSGLKTRYELTSHIATDENGDGVRRWGILCVYGDKSYGNVIQMIHFSDVSDCCAVAVNIIELLREYNVCIVHAQQIIEDYLTETNSI